MLSCVSSINKSTKDSFWIFLPLGEKWNAVVGTLLKRFPVSSCLSCWHGSWSAQEAFQVLCWLFTVVKHPKQYLCPLFHSSTLCIYPSEREMCPSSCICWRWPNRGDHQGHRAPWETCAQSDLPWSGLPASWHVSSASSLLGTHLSCEQLRWLTKASLGLSPVMSVNGVACSAEFPNHCCFVFKGWSKGERGDVPAGFRWL